MTAAVFATLAACAALGLLLSAAAHLASLLGKPVPTRAILLLSIGVAAIWAPFVASGIVLRAKRIQVIGYPIWWRRASRYFFIYFGILFGLAIFTMLRQGDDVLPDPRNTAPYLGRLFSAGWILFYGAATFGFAAFGRTVGGRR